jgi:hypothetical protein
VTRAIGSMPWHARRVRARAWLTAAAVVALAGWEPFRTVDPDVEAGNRAYAEGRYDDALAAYDRAARRGGVDGDGLAYDRGTAELRKAEELKDPVEKRRLTERALEDLKQAARARDPRIRGGANYNRGNALMGQDRLEDAIEAYKQALREDPELDDARLNLELALRRREKQQQKQQQQGQGQGQQGQGQQGQGSQGQGQGQGQQGQGQGSNQGSGSGSDAQNGSNGSNQQNGSNGGGSGSNQQNGSNGGGSNQQNGSNGSGADQSGQGSAQGSNQPNDDQGQQGSGQNQSGQNQNGPRGRGQRRSPQSPRTPTEGKLDDLDNFSRKLQKDEARRRATGKSSDPQHDW